MRRVFTTLPLPRVLCARHGLEAVALRAALAARPDAERLAAEGERLLGTRNAAASVKAAAGLMAEADVRDVLVATAGEIVDFRAAFSVLSPRVRTHVLPIFPMEAERTGRAVEEVLGRVVGEGARDTGSATDAQGSPAGNPGRTPFRPVGACKVAKEIGRGDGAAPGGGRVAVLGPLVGFPDLVGRIGALGGRVVYEEWRELAAEMEEAEDWAGALACGPLVAGLPARLARLRAIAAEVQAAILVTEPFCALAMEETFFRRVLIETRLPMLVLEAEGYGPMDAARVTRLEAFAEAAMKNER